MSRNSKTKGITCKTPLPLNGISCAIQSYGKTRAQRNRESAEKHRKKTISLIAALRLGIEERDKHISLLESKLKSANLDIPPRVFMDESPSESEDDAIIPETQKTSPVSKPLVQNKKSLK